MIINYHMTLSTTLLCIFYKTFFHCIRNFKLNSQKCNWLHESSLFLQLCLDKDVLNLSPFIIQGIELLVCVCSYCKTQHFGGNDVNQYQFTKIYILVQFQPNKQSADKHSPKYYLQKFVSYSNYRVQLCGLYNLWWVNMFGLLHTCQYNGI